MEFLKNTAAQVKGRVDTAMEAKKLLEEGGTPVEVYISTKANLRSTVESDAVSEAQMQDCIAQYTEALQQVERALPQISSDQQAELQALIPAYRDRVQSLRAALAAVTTPPPPLPLINAVEDDAVKLLYVKGKVEDAKNRTSNIADNALAKLNSRKNQPPPTA